MEAPPINPLTPVEQAELHALNAELSAAKQSGEEPRCIARAFASPLADTIEFTMQTWIDLEAIRSPILRGEEFASPTQMQAAAKAFEMDLASLEPDEAAHVLVAMRKAVLHGFEMAVEMTPPDGDGGKAASGFGVWLPIYSKLVADCGVQPEAALRMQVGRAFALIGCVLRNRGWKCGSPSYAEKDVLNDEPSRETQPSNH